MRTISKQGVLGVALLIAACQFGATANAQQWVMATPYPDSNFHTKNIRQFADDVKAATNGKLTINIHSRQSLVAMPQIKRAIQSGQAHLGEILLSAYGNEDPFFEVDGVPMIAPGFQNAKKLWEVSKPYVVQKFESQGLVPLFSVPWPPQGFYTKSPVNSLNDFKGVKFRAYNAVTARMAELMGAVPTTVQQAEVPQAFATGAVDAMVTSAATGVDVKAWDFAKYYYDVRVINNKNIVLVSKRALDALDPTTRQAVLKAAAQAEINGWIASEKTMEETTKKLAQEGMKVEAGSELMKQQLDKIGLEMSREWVKKAGANGEKMLQGMK